MLIRQATMEDFDQISALIHASTKKLIEKHVYQWAYPYEVHQLEKQIVSGEVYLLEENKRLIGSYSIKPVSAKFPIQIEDGMYIYRMLIHPFYQGKNMPDFMFKHIRRAYKQHPVVMDCWAGNEKISNFYRSHECLYLGDFPEEDYKISVYQVVKAEKNDKENDDTY